MKRIKSYLLGLIVLLIILFGTVVLIETYQVKVPVNPSQYNKQTISHLRFTEKIKQQNYNLFKNDKYFEFSNWNPYIDEKINIYIPANLCQKLFECYVNMQDSSRILIKKGEIEIQMEAGSSQFSVNGNLVDESLVPFSKEEILYIPLEIIANKLGYEIDLNTQNGIISINGEGVQTILEKYDYRTVGRSPSIKDQGYLSTCWAVASLSALESFLLPNEDIKLSADHMSIQNNFSNTQSDGGNYTMSMAYLVGWQGPILEADDPYGDGISVEGIAPIKHVQGIQIIKEKDYEKIKEMVYKYGAIQTSIYLAMETQYMPSIYYNQDTYSYCYTGEESPNHEVIIIGWDDTYPVENFNGIAKNNGAFICQNSWGTKFGEEGIFYVSYEDFNIGKYNLAYTRIDEPSNYDNIYQTDLCGWVGQLGYDKNTVYFANIYTTPKQEKLAAVGFYATNTELSYEIYIVRDFKDETSFKSKEILQVGSIENVGYYTIDIKDKIILEKDEKYAIVVNVKRKKGTASVAVEYEEEASYVQKIDLENGEGYISADGKTFERTESKYKSNVCLKAYTDDIN